MRDALSPDLTPVVAGQPDPLLFEALHAVPDVARGASAVPERPTAYDALDEFVVRRRVAAPER